ncbi:MAG: hypothetical protein OHK006_19950 [Thermodesulfovibrionales bacterium]
MTLPPRRVLLAEDDAGNRILATRILEQAGYQVTTAGHGREAAELCETTFFDVILMDIQMPVLDGFGATERIRAKGKNRLAPIIAFTAIPDPAIRERCLAMGMDGFLPKPPQPAAVIGMIETWISRTPLILVADDSRDSRALLRRHLKNYRTLFAKNGIEAISAVRDHRVACVLMDMEMPVMDGYTAARTIVSLPSGQAVPIIAMTSHEGSREVEKCLKVGCAAFLQKPVKADELGRVLARHLKTTGGDNTPGTGAAVPQPAVSIDPDLREIIPDFLEERRNDIAEISRLLVTGGFDEILRIGHSMKGSGGGYGFPEISAIGAGIERAARHRDARKVAQLNTRLGEYLETVSIIYREPS